MNVYVYQAALLCEECGDKCKAELTAEGNAPKNPSNENTFDSDNFPKGPYASDSNEADSPHHCEHCGIFLENPLTNEGHSSLYGMVLEALKAGKCSDALREWVNFYDVDLNDMINHFCPKA